MTAKNSVAKETFTMTGRVNKTGAEFTYWFPTDGNLEVFLSGTVLNRSGFKAEQLVNADIVLEYKIGAKGPVATKVLTIGGEAGEVKQSKGKPKGKATFGNYEVEDTGFGRVTVFKNGYGFIRSKGRKDIFFHYKDLVNVPETHIVPGILAEFEVIAGNRDVQARITSVRFGRKTEGLITQVVDKANGLVVVKLSLLGSTLTTYQVREKSPKGKIVDTCATLADARKVIGHEIVPPTAEGHGVKTNVPTLSKSMKGQGKGGK